MIRKKQKNNKSYPLYITNLMTSLEFGRVQVDIETETKFKSMDMLFVQVDYNEFSAFFSCPILENVSLV